MMSSKPAMRRSRVVLPQPDGPSSVKNSLSLIVSEAPASAVTEPNRLTALRTSIAIVPSVKTPLPVRGGR